MANLTLGLSVVFTVNGMLARVKAGRLVALLSGHCDVTATLTLEGADIVTKQAHLDLPGAISLGQGIRLLPAEDYPPGPSRPADDPRPWWEKT